MSTAVLIAGANGFLGRALVKKCLAQGLVVDALINRSRDNMDPGIRNVISVSSLPEVTGLGYEYIFNAAAFIPYGAYNKPDEQLLDSNIGLVMDLHKSFPGSKIVFASSVSVYGNNTGVIDETSECISPNMYGLSKLAGELITAHHAAYAVVRFSSLYGKGMYSGTFIPRIIDDAKKRGVISLMGAGARKQNYLHVDDAAGYCMHAALNGNNEVYLGVSPHEYQNREVADIIAAGISGCRVMYTGVDNSPSFLYKNEHTVNALRFTPLINLEEGLKELINE